MHIIGLMLVSLALAAQGTAKVETTFDKKTDFAALHTYSWTAGLHAFNQDAHKIIVAAFEAEMAGLGFTKVASGGDVTVAYYTVAGTNVDLKALDKIEKEGRGGTAPTKTFGRLVVIMRGAATNQQIWTASTREYVESDPAKLGDTLRGVTARLFETYPGRKGARSK